MPRQDERDPREGERTTSGRYVRSIALWVGIPFLVLVAAEFVVRAMDRSSYIRASWYEGVSDRMEAGDRVDYLFLGTSRTASGLIPSSFEAEVESQTAEDAVCINLGRAFSGAVAHYFGLRMLLERHPEAMRECTVSIEMSAGLPAFPATWDEDWYFPGSTQLAVDYMKGDDLARFLRTDAGFEAKSGVTARYLGRGSALVSGRRQVQQAVEWRGLALVRNTLARLGAESAAASGELPAHRQLRSDFGGVQMQRDLVMERVSPEVLAAQQPLGPWGDQVLCQAAELLRENGVSVVFHEVPVPSYVWEVNETETRRADRRAFVEWREGLGIEEARVSISVTDEDFPDLSHLRQSRVDEYSRDLARSVLAVGR